MTQAAQTILLIEDSKLVQEVYKRKLMLEHFRVVVAGGGMEALAILSREVPDLILLDLMMPGVDGYRLLEIVRQEPRLREVPVVVITAKNQTDELQRALDLGAAYCVVKATTPPNDVVSRIRAIVAERRRHAGLYRVRLDSAALDAPRLAADLRLLGLACAGCGEPLIIELSVTEGGTLSAQLVCPGCGGLFPQPQSSQVWRRPV